VTWAGVVLAHPSNRCVPVLHKQSSSW